MLEIRIGKLKIKLDKCNWICYNSIERREADMSGKYGYIFDKAIEELDSDRFDKWLCASYGVLEDNMTEAQAELLLKFLEQDKKAQAEAKK
jgi:hypothetical protein